MTTLYEVVFLCDAIVYILITASLELWELLLGKGGFLQLYCGRVHYRGARAAGREVQALPLVWSNIWIPSQRWLLTIRARSPSQYSVKLTYPMRSLVSWPWKTSLTCANKHMVATSHVRQLSSSLSQERAYSHTQLINMYCILSHLSVSISYINILKHTYCKILFSNKPDLQTDSQYLPNHTCMYIRT
jgi:hypothetical protein